MRSLKQKSLVWLGAPVFVVVAMLCAMLGCRDADPWKRLMCAAAEADSRPLESLPSDLQYRPLRTGNGISPALQVAASEVLETSAAAEGDAEKQHAAGIALLILHRPSTAVVRLERAVQSSPGNASWWNDLAIAKYETGRPANTLLLMEALAAIDRAIALKLKTPIARFNRALILEALKLRVSASYAWHVCMTTDPSSGVAIEARRRFESWKGEPRSARWKSELPRLRRVVAAGNLLAVRGIVAAFSQESRSWGEVLFLGGWADADRSASESAGDLALARAVGAALRDSTGESLLADAVAVIDAASTTKLAVLRRAQQTYTEGRALYRDRRVSESLPLFRSAAVDFRRADSPMADVAEYYATNVLHDLGRHAESLALIDALLARVPKRYISLRSQLLWERGTVLTRTGKLTDALSAQREALRQFEQLDEPANATHMLNMIAISLSLLGRRDEAWALRQDLFDRASQLGEAALLQTILDSTARADALAQHWPEAFSLLTLSLEPPAVQTNSRVAATSHLWRALASARLGLATGVADVAAARQIAPRVVDPVLRSSVLIEADFAEAILSDPDDHHRAKQLLTRYIDTGVQARDAYLLPEACLARARLRRSEGDFAGAIADLHEAWRWLEKRRDGTTDEYRDAYFATRDHVRRELVDIHCDRAEYWQAFVAAEERIEPSGEPLDRTAMTSAIPAGTIVIRYVVLPRRLVIFVLSGRAFETVTVPLAPEALARASSELAEAIVSDRESVARERSVRLGKWLLAPVSNQLRDARRLVVVNDAALDAVPYAMLPYGDELKPLIEQMELLFSQDVSSHRTDGGMPLRAGPVLAVGDPRVDPKLFPELGRLGAAAEEARTVAAIYEQREVFTGAAATPTAIIERLKSAVVADFATHAVVVASAPSRSFLVLAGSGSDSGTLSVDDIERLHVGPLHLVVLAGCRTAAPTTGGGTATSIALAFTRAGAQNSIGNLWDMDDEVARSWSSALHGRIREGMSPAAALRQSQIAMLQSSDPAARRYRAWSGLRLYSAP